MLNARDQQVAQVVERNQAAPIVQRTKWQRPTALHCAYQCGKVGFDARPIYQRGPNNHDLHAGLQGYRTQAKLGKRPNIPAAMRQAQEATDGRMPLV